MARDEEFNFHRFLLWVLGALFSLASFLGNRQISKLEADQAANALGLADLRITLFRELDPLKERGLKYGVAIDNLEKFRDRNLGLEEERSKRMGEDEGSIRVLITEAQQLAKQIARLEGREDNRELEQQGRKR